MFLLHALWFFLAVVIPILIPVAYAAVGARVLTYAVQNRIPLKIAPGFGEWAVMAAYCTVGWPVALLLWSDLRPALKPMNRRDRDRLAMALEVDAMKDAVAFAAHKEVHRTAMDELHGQLSQIEHSSTLRAIEASKADEEGAKEPVALGYDAQRMLHLAEFQFNKEKYLDRHKLKTRTAYNSQPEYYKNSGCYHADMGELLECQNCSPIAEALRVKKTLEREASKARGAAAWDKGQKATTRVTLDDDDEIVEAEFA